MTECIPNSYSSFPCQTKQRFRRPSIVQATISSIAKDVRSKEDVSSLLRKKSSSINLTKANQPKRRQTTTDSRSKSDKNLNSASPSVKVRCDNNIQTSSTLIEDDFLYMQKKYPKKEKKLAFYGSTDSLSSISSLSSSSSSNSKHSHTPWAFAQPPPLSTKIPIHQLRETVLEDLGSLTHSYTHHLQNLTASFSSNSMDTMTYQKPRRNMKHKTQIQDCKALLRQQQDLLNQLESLVQDDTEPDQPKEIPIYSQENPSPLLQKLKNALVNPTGVTQLVIRKNKTDTVISVQGVCETSEPSLIPYKLERQDIYHFQFKLDINKHDRLTRFNLLPSDQWQKDHTIHSCQFSTCSTQFTLLQRKHHCRSCGDIVCSSHSKNRLPLFTFEDHEKPNFSRVCDTCFFSLASKHLSLYT